MDKIKKLFESKVFTKIIYGVGILIILIIVFSVGISVGFHRASFGQAWTEHYYNNFGMMSARRDLGFGENYFPNAHGASGKILKITLPTMIVQDKDKTEKVVLLADDTDIEKGRNDVTADAINIDDFVVVIGTPNGQGQIEAKLIRVLPNPKFIKQ